MGWVWYDDWQMSVICPYLKSHTSHFSLLWLVVSLCYCIQWHNHQVYKTQIKLSNYEVLIKYESRLCYWMGYFLPQMFSERKFCVLFSGNFVLENGPSMAPTWMCHYATCATSHVSLLWLNIGHISLLWLVVGLSNWVRRHFGLLIITPLWNWMNWEVTGNTRLAFGYS